MLEVKFGMLQTLTKPFALVKHCVHVIDTYKHSVNITMLFLAVA